MIWDVMKVSEDKPHRKANSCKRVRTDLTECIRKSPCFVSGAPFEECISTQDREWIGGEQCLQLRHAYFQCRRVLANPNFRFTVETRALLFSVVTDKKSGFGWAQGESRLFGGWCLAQSYNFVAMTTSPKLRSTVDTLCLCARRLSTGYRDNFRSLIVRPEIMLPVPNQHQCFYIIHVLIYYI